MSLINCDVLIAGGGLAGLTLALQLRDAAPGLEVVVLERNREEPPDAAFKVGESTVEIGAHYLAQTLGLKTLLDETQLRKFGLRFFFNASGNDLSDADELGASDYFGSPTYQVDRGRLERDLFRLVTVRGVEARRGCTVTALNGLDEPGPAGVRFRDDAGEYQARCKWFVDASGRAGVLKRAKSLDRPTRHATCSAWFRVDKVIDVDDWSGNEGWKNRNPGGGRLLSTNHLMGPGYWVWIIPLRGDRTSIGVVSDPDILPLEQYKTFPGFRDWAAGHHPLLAESLGNVCGEPMDFRYFPTLARDSKQVWSADGWAFTGESAVFADPFYSPGTDYIALANTFITRFVTQKGTQEDRKQDMRYCHALFRSFFASTMSLYQGQYGGFGDARLMAVKSIWDYVYYWSVLAWLFFHGRVSDAKFLRQCEPDLQAAFSLNNRMQAVFRQRAAGRQVIDARGRFFDQQAIPILGELNHGLLHSSEMPENELKSNCARLGAVADELENLLANSNLGRGGPDSALFGDLASRLA